MMRPWGQSMGRICACALVAALGAMAGCQPAGTLGAAQPGASSAALVSASDPASAAEAADAAAATQASASAQSASQTTAKRLRGIYTWGSEVETLSPCNSNKTYWLEGDEELLAPLQELALQKAAAANEAYQPIYVEVLASDAGRATDGFAVDYDGLMLLQAVQSASAQVPPDCKLLDAPELPIVTDEMDAADASGQGAGKPPAAFSRSPSAPSAR